MGCAMRLGCAALLAGAFLLYAGLHGLYTAVKNPTPTEITYDEYAEEKPSAEWLKLTECMLDVPDYAYAETGGAIKEMYIPLRSPSDQDNEGKILVLLLTSDEEWLTIGNEMKELPEGDEGAMLAYMIKNAAKMYPTRDVQGVLQFGINSDSDDRKQLAGLFDNMDPDFVVLEHNAEPSLGASVFMTALGLVLILGVIGIGIATRSNEDETHPDAALPDETAAEAAPAGDSLPDETD